ncbi:MAG: hypothetical protein ABIJ09_23665 [Pseudomonadota bacterium]
MTTSKTTFFFFLATLLLGACAREYIGDDPPLDRLHFPIGIAVSPTERTALVVSSNFDLGFNRGAVLSIDLGAVDARLDAATAPLADAITDVFSGAAFLPSFAGQVRFDDSGRHAFVPNRAEASLLELELGTPQQARALSCGDRGEVPQDCTAGDHVLQLTAADPYAIEVQSRSDGARIYVGGLDGGEVNGVDADFTVSGERRLTLPVVVDSELQRASGLARLPASGLAPEYLLIAGELRPASSDPRPAGAYLRLFSTGLASSQNLGAVPLVSANQAADARGVVVTADGTRAFVLQRGPDSVAAVDLTPGVGGLPRFRTVAVQSVGRKPVAIALDASAPGAAQILVACFEEKSLYALDARTLQIVAVIPDLDGSPADLAVDGASARAYVTLFDRDVVAVISLDRPEHPGLTVQAWLGTPRPTPDPSWTLDNLSPL